MPRLLSMPRSPFSTAMKTERKCSRSERIKCSAAPKSSIVWDSEKKESEVESTVNIKIMVKVLSKWQTQFLMTFCITDGGTAGKNIASVSVHFIVSLSGVFGFPVIFFNDYSFIAFVGLGYYRLNSCRFISHDCTFPTYKFSWCNVFKQCDIVAFKTVLKYTIVYKQGRHHNVLYVYCIYVRIYVSVCVCMYVCMYVCKSTCWTLHSVHTF